ncbi:MAG: Rieske 2Fe-2S domain-containing protein [Granulosicoccus sp.]|nr:Rieske 2Fe-2S domain-containing protein [Granulosicoccus sp.]
MTAQDDRPPTSHQSKAWQTIIRVDQLETGDATPVHFQGLDLAVFDTSNGITVSLARCTHGAANLCDGYFDGKNIECPLHQGLFDARSGEALAAPATRRLKMFESRVVDGAVQILK